MSMKKDKLSDERESPSGPNDKKKSVPNRKRLVRAFVVSFLLAAFCMYAIMGMIRLSRTISFLTASDQKAEEIIDELRADIETPVDADFNADAIEETSPDEADVLPVDGELPSVEDVSEDLESPFDEDDARASNARPFSTEHDSDENLDEELEKVFQ